MLPPVAATISSVVLRRILQKKGNIFFVVLFPRCNDADIPFNKSGNQIEY